MLHFMRKHAKFFYVFFFLIIISFIFFYVGPVDRNGQLSVIEVGKEKVSLKEYWRAYENMKSFYSDIYKDKFNADMEKKLGLKEKILQEMLNSKVLYVAAVDAGLVVSDRELMDDIMNDPSFQRDGKFRRDIYLKTLQLNRIPPRYYEEKKKEELLVKKMRQLVENAVVLSDQNLLLPQGDPKLQKALRDSMEKAKKEQVVQSFVDAMMMKYRPVVRFELVS